jgi:hypothetical protein
MNHAFAFIAIGSVIGCASAPVQTSAIMPNGNSTVTSAPTLNLYARIPAAIGAFTLTERTTVKGLPTDSLFRFSDGSPTIVSLIIYEVGADVKIDADSQKWTAREGEKFSAVQDVQVSRGQIAAYRVAFSKTARLAAGARNIPEHSIAIPTRFPNGEVTVEMQYLYLIDGKFVKVRATIPYQIWQQSHVPSFARELAIRIAGRT